MANKWVIALVGGVAFGIVMVIASPEDKPGEATRAAETTPEDKARVACRYAVEKVANDPPSIEWVDRYDWPVAIDGDDIRVAATLRAKNGFGALILTSMTCKMRRESNGDVRILSVTED